MTGDVRIENLNVGNMIVMPDAAPETMADGIFAFLQDEIRRSDDPAIMSENGEPVPDEVAQPDESPTPEEQVELDQFRAEHYVLRQAAIDVISRNNHLRNVVHHVRPARKLEGFQTNHERSPRKRSAVDRKQAAELKLAEISLKRACASCEFVNDCKLANSINSWIDVHPYARDNTGKRRAGSSPVKEVESQKAFLDSQAVGVYKRRQVHCDPAKRK